MTSWDESKPLVGTPKEEDTNGDQLTSSGTYASTITSSSSSKEGSRETFTLSQWLEKHLSWIERDAVYFGVRMSVCITIASFAILLREPGDEFVPQAMWIVVTVLFVCWFPTSLDAASVVEKSLQRLYGTFLGASTGLACGFLSLLILYHGHEEQEAEEEGTGLWFANLEGAADKVGRVIYDDEFGVSLSQPGEHANNAVAQSAFLISCIAIYTFVICWGAIQFKTKKTAGAPKIITKFNYACILSLLTFYISILPFYSDNGAKWRKARWRVTNVIIGCFLGAGLSISVFPRSTKSIVKHKLQLQLKLAGEASQAVLHAAAEQFSETAYVLPSKQQRQRQQQQQQQHRRTSSLGSPLRSIRERLTLSRRLWRRNDPAVMAPADDDEIAIKKYEAAMGGWRTIKTQLNNLRYDPFRLGSPDVRLTEFRTEVNNILARIQRIQTTVVLMDGIVKNDPKHNFSATHINRLARIGTLICNMLNVTLPPQEQSSTNHTEANMAAYTELKAELASIRRDIVELAGVVANAPQDNAQNYVGKLDKGLIGRSNLDLTQMMAMAAAAAAGNGDATAIPEEDDDLEDHSWNDPFHHAPDFGGRGAPKHVQGSRVCALLFLQLVEHLALRSLRTFQAWKQCDAW